LHDRIPFFLLAQTNTLIFKPLKNLNFDPATSAHKKFVIRPACQ
jgi:hypothetical protein